LQRSQKKRLLHLVLLVRYVRITVGDGKTGSLATPGGDLRNYVSPLLVFPLFSP
jgi:hypothetical protein